ncbi:MAG: substrate-binding domain-containing protein [Rhodospirillaceae bacterium]
MRWISVIGLMFMGALTVSAQADEPFITVASTTSTEQSGLFGHLLPLFKEKTGITVRIVALGTGQALKTAENGDVDMVFVHDRPAEDAFIAKGFGIERRDVMHNDFIMVGPRADPAGIAKAGDAVTAMGLIAASGAVFVSRGDNSGTNAAELRLWRAVGLAPQISVPAWYRATGSGMGPTLNVAAGLDGYTLADRGTWLSFRNRGNLAVLYAGDRRLFNPYGVILVNPARHPHVRVAQARSFVEWLVSPAGQAAIADFKIDGEQLFFPDAICSCSVE